MGKTGKDKKKVAEEVATKKAVVEKAGKAKKSKKASAGEIDDIFATARAKKRAVQEEKEHEQKQEEKRKQRMQKVKASRRAADTGTADASSLDSSLDPHAAAKSARRRDEDGLSIYTMEELGITTNPRAGTTPLCPFDCDCCH